MSFRWLAVLIFSCVILHAQSSSYLGFDRNTYPGDANLKTLHETFSYTGYWLNNPPSEKTNTWTGHRAAVEAAGLGFLVLFNGRLYAELKSVAQAAKLGHSDAQTAAAAARREGFPRAYDHLPRSGAGRAHAARAEGLHLCVGRRRHRCGISRGGLLLRYGGCR